MHDGSRIAIDHNTNKVIRTSEGETTPLWDGVHNLNNGARIIVRDGVVVKDSAIIEAQREQERDHLNAACMQLVRKVCGPHNECDAHPACDPARQLLAMERHELNGSRPGAVPESSVHCLEALGNEGFFRICNKRQSGKETPCEKLQLKVCGSHSQCDAREACNAARQLIAMEQQDLHNAPDGLTYAGGQCRDALTNVSTFFQACE
ncbi:MAG: hypothetical protein KZQ76_09935 [Candidatus Thiodiazotropha sp. (ex Epidulcina cf. delphinae)]|nr:hypothetical protein [Candidatus Thiodiazotropha sp. (ex Epidulcina cf. delphinae)]